MALASFAALAADEAGPRYARVEGGSFASVLRYDDVASDVVVRGFEMRATPVTNAEFARFVAAQPQWRRDAVPTVFAEPRYLSHWTSAEAFDPAIAKKPVTQVSWFAAQAFCESEHARLPTWTEWEYAAAADETRVDARSDPQWRARILDWYSRPSGHALDDVAQGPATVHGIHDLHTLVWEWVEDHGALLVSSDNREQGDPDLLKFCGAGALSMRDRENYAVLMRIAMLSSLRAADTTANLGFRCVRPLPPEKK